MPEKESLPERLLREAIELRETAVDMMEHAALLITKSIEIDEELAKREKDASKKQLKSR
jgi:hypothetical protein